MWQIIPGCRRPLVTPLCFAVLYAFLQAGCGSSQHAVAGTGAAASNSALTAPATGSQGTTASTAAPAAGSQGAIAPAAEPAKGEVPSPAAKPKSATAIPPTPLPQPPDGKWLVDAQGRQYFVSKIPKREGSYTWLNPEKTRVQVLYGARYEVLGQDADSFQVKIYRVDTTERHGPTKLVITPEKLAEVAASYRNDTGTVDRLQFEPFGHGLPESGQWRNGFRIADMNGDGFPDIVLGPERKGRRVPNIYLGDGKGNWRLWSEAKFPQLPYDYGDIAVADFNGDGRPDLALGVHLHGVIVLIADGPQSFKEWGKGLDFYTASSYVASPKEPIFSSHAVAVADMNGDGRPDLIAVGEGPRLALPTPGERASAVPGGYGMVIYFNQGDGSWVRRGESAADRVRLYGDKVAIGDFTHDGKLDAILGSNVLGLKSILRIGAADGSWTVADLKDLRHSFVSALNIADFNGDGRLDLAVGYLSVELGVWRTGIDLFLGREDGSWERRPLAVEEGNKGGLTALDSGDIDGDGKLDLAALTGDGKIWILLGKGDGSFVRQTPEIPPVQGGCKGYDVKIANLDGEPGGEIVAEFAGEPSPLFAPNLCVDEGRVVAWKARQKK